MTQLSTGQVTLVNNTPIQIVPARVGRKELRIDMGSHAGVRIGDSSLSSSNGYALPVNVTTLMDMEGEVWGLGGAFVIQYLEIY